MPMQKKAIQPKSAFRRDPANAENGEEENQKKNLRINIFAKFITQRRKEHGGKRKI
jgi:hypothetical protein